MKGRKMVAIASMLMTGVMVTAIGAGCGGGVGQDLDLSVSIESIQAKYDASLYQYSGEPVTIRMSHWDSDGATLERAVLETLLTAFKNRYPTIDVKLDIISDYENTYATNIATNNLHDVFMVSDGAFTNWAGGGKMVNLTPYIQASDLVDTSGMYPSVVSRYQYDAVTGLTGSGAQLVMPRDISAHVMYYNKDYFAAKGIAEPPKDRVMTIDEATELWQALTERDSSGDIEVYGVAGLEMEGLVWSAGGDFLNDARTGFPTEQNDLDALKRAYQYIQDAFFKYEVTPPSEFSSGMDPTTLFSMQRVATVIAGSWCVSSFRTLDFDWDIAYAPAFEENPSQNSWSGSVGYAISNDCPNKEAAWKLVEYVGSQEGQEILSATGFQFPLYEDIGLSEGYLKRESSLKPNNYEIFIHSVATQPAGTWMYTKSTQWKELAFDMYSEYIFHNDPEKRWTIDYFLERVKKDVNQYLA